MWITIVVLSFLLVLFGSLIMITGQRMKSLKNVKESEKIKILTDQNFQNKIKTGTVLVDFWAAWCMPCKMMVPVLNELVDETNGKVTIAKLNVDEQKATASKYNVRSIPTVILFQHGKEVKRIVGVKTKEYFLKELDRRNSL